MSQQNRLLDGRREQSQTANLCDSRPRQPVKAGHRRVVLDLSPIYLHPTDEDLARSVQRIRC